MQEGWVCPKCGRVNSPYVLQCPCTINNPIIIQNPPIYIPCAPSYPPVSYPPYYVTCDSKNVGNKIEVTCHIDSNDSDKCEVK